MPKTKEQQPEVRLARDEFTVALRALEKHPEGVQAESRVDVIDFYGNVVTWNLNLFRVEGAVTALVQIGAAVGYQRLVIPPKVTAVIYRHFSGLASKHRRKQAKRSVADLRAQSGEEVSTQRPRRRR